MTTRAEFVAYARSLIGTPWRHRERQPGIAIDCGGVVICAMRATGLCAPDFDVPEYGLNPNGTMIPLCEQYLVRVAKSEMQPADVLITINDEEPQHVSILGDYRHGGLSMIHATRDPRYMRVIETRLLFSKHQRFAAAFRIPGIE